MAFIGTPLDTRNTFQSLQGKRFNGDGSTTDFTLDVTPSSTLDIEVFVGNVRQDPNSAYTLSGTTLAFTGAPPSGTNNIYVVHQAKSVGTIDPPATETIAKTFSGTVTMSGTNTLSGATTVSGALTASGGATISGTNPTLTVGDAGAEDAKIVFDGNAQDYHIGLDDSADDLVIGLGSTLGTTSHIVIDENGHVTKPLQSAFLVIPASTQSNVATDSDVTVAFGTEVIDRNGDFSSNTFTAPVTGLYQLNATIEVENVDGAGDTYSKISFKASNRDRRFFIDYNRVQTDSTIMTMAGSILVDMDANDTVHLEWYQAGGTAQADISAQSTFSGALIC
jgi:autotransporter-associated beta strand protein